MQHSRTFLISTATIMWQKHLIRAKVSSSSANARGNIGYRAGLHAENLRGIVHNVTTHATSQDVAT